MIRCNFKIFTFSIFIIVFTSISSEIRGFVTTGWLRSNCTKENIRILDVRELPQEYAKSHIPGAIHCKTDLFRGKESSHKELSVIQKNLGNIGITNATTIVIYSIKQDWRPYYIAWALEHLGHSSVTVLEGGFEKWVNEQRPCTQDTPSFKLAHYNTNNTIGNDLCVDDKELGSHLANDSTVLLYIESGSESEKNSAKSNIVFRSIKNDIDENGSWREYSTLKQQYESSGITSNKTIIVFSADGVQSSFVYFTLKHVLAYPKVKQFDGQASSLAALLPINSDKNLHSSTW